MNIQFKPRKTPVRVLVTNPLCTSSRLLLLKFLTGSVLGLDQIIDLILLVYENELNSAELFKMELECCANFRTNKITVMTTLPRISDADIFCFMTTFVKVNKFSPLTETDDDFDSLYLLLKIAYNFSKEPMKLPETEENTEESKKKKRKRNIQPEVKKMRPIFITDGLVALDILMTFSKIIPTDCLFCITCLPNIARKTLAEYLKVNCNDINNTYVWGANDELFHVEFDRPIITYDTTNLKTTSNCNWVPYGKLLSEKTNSDYVQFNAFWLQMDFVQKIAALAKSNPYGPIWRATHVARFLAEIWKAREDPTATPSLLNMGVISDGSSGTIKGLPYILPVKMFGDKWTLDDNFAQRETNRPQVDVLLKGVVKEMNNEVSTHHAKLTFYCKKFWQRNVIDRKFVVDSDSHIDTPSTTSVVSDGQCTEMKEKFGVSHLCRMQEII